MNDDLLPDDDLDLTNEEAFALAEAEPAGVEDFLGLGPGDDPDLVLSDEGDFVRPIGRSWAFDPGGRGFIGAHGPLVTTGLSTLRFWIAKCLATERDSLMIHPPGYGVEGLNRLIGEAMTTGVGAALEEPMREALLFHPNVTDVTDFTSFVGTDNDDEALFIQCRVVTNKGDEFAIEGLRII